MPKLPNRKLHCAQITTACTSTSIFIWMAILFAKTFPERRKLKPSPAKTASRVYHLHVVVCTMCCWRSGLLLLLC